MRALVTQLLNIIMSFYKEEFNFFFSVLFLDSLDQLSDQDDGRSLRWLPTSLPENVHIVVSTLPNTGGCLAVLKTKLKPESNADFYLEVRSFLPFPLSSMFN